MLTGHARDEAGVLHPVRFPCILVNCCMTHLSTSGQEQRASSEPFPGSKVKEHSLSSGKLPFRDIPTSMVQLSSPNDCLRYLQVWKSAWTPHSKAKPVPLFGSPRSLNSTLCELVPSGDRDVLSLEKYRSHDAGHEASRSSGVTRVTSEEGAGTTSCATKIIIIAKIMGREEVDRVGFHITALMVFLRAAASPTGRDRSRDERGLRTHDTHGGGEEQRAKYAWVKA